MVGKLVTFSPTSCEYVRGSQSETLDMRRSPQPTQVVEVEGRLIEWEPVDFLVATTDLPFGQPEDNDRIICTINGETLTHGVYIPGNAKASRDLSSAMTRIHTKVIQKA